jgi:TolB-like protein
VALGSDVAEEINAGYILAGNVRKKGPNIQLFESKLR